MSERIQMSVSTPSDVPMGTSAAAPIRASIHDGGQYVTYAELQAILAGYPTREEMNNDTIMRWQGETNA